MAKSKIKVGIVGSAGYTGGELIRILLQHPDAEISFVHSNSNAGNPIHAVHRDLIGYTDLSFTDTLSDDIDVLFLCVGHGDAKVFLQNNPVSSGIKIIDLSHDHRLLSTDHDFVYGLPELQSEKIKSAGNIANPGCFATAIQLALLPLAKAGLLTKEVHITAITGSTGAGQKPSSTSHFSWRNNNISAYKAFNHQHLHEIKQSLKFLDNSFKQPVNFVPLRGDFARGILVSAYIDFDGSQEEAKELYKGYYQNAAFTHVTDYNPDLKQVVNTNNCLVYPELYDGKLHIISIIDNLTKGASGQAVQNMNLLFGLDEKSGLMLKPSAF